ncbi:NADPH-dependent FMN reductase [Cyanobium sp. Morenito 9A2]|uniref:NADPH-dependent FMN reductase n=1 Tax=Cyanobium sp. Morenito 9A2 TaxID=2823718 RepID=UPI0020CCCF97|nr:NAD(P)H-dependent oxidoreductase [Cyanobium sp. Morenito 9A2]MCP9850175.1 NAD(P)H-dependent oxidoreductase [Cyanobium sp. Morenito 9A2]
MIILTASSGQNRVLAQLVAERAQALGHGSQLIDLTVLDLPLFTPARQSQGPGEPLEVLARVLLEQRRLWVCAPEYNGSLPPTLVNAIAWLSTSSADFRALFQGVPVALSTHSGGGGQKLLCAMRQQFAHLGALVIGRELLSTPQKAANPESIDAMLAELHRIPAPSVA